MNFLFLTLCVAASTILSVHNISHNSTNCNFERIGNPATATYHNTQPTQIARTDYSSFMHKTLTSPACTEYIKETVILSTQSAPTKFLEEPEALNEIPDAHRSAYTPSICASLGITPNTTTVLAQPITMTATEAISDISLTSNIPTSIPTPENPTCTADTHSDPLNCGECGNICETGICEFGSCTNTKCRIQSCGNFDRCNEGEGDCYCFSSAEPVGNSGFCSKNTICTGLTACGSDSDCVESNSGNKCAISTCCPVSSHEKPGVCLEGQCGNPSQKLAIMSKFRSMKGNTAAF